MFSYQHHCGNFKDFISESDLDYIVKRMEKLDSIPVPEGSCHGIDINYTDMYDWFVENILDRLREYTQRSDLNLIYGFLGNMTQSFKIHRDIKTIPEKEHNPRGTQFASFLIPVSVDFDPNKCCVNSTMIFDNNVLENPADDLDWHYKVKDINPYYYHDVHGWIDHRHYNLIDEYKWGRGDLIWWNSLYPHCGLDNNVLGIKTKQMLVIHTYV